MERWKFWSRGRESEKEVAVKSGWGPWNTLWRSVWTRAAVLTSGSGAWNQARRVPGDQGTHWLSSILVGGVSQGKHSAPLKITTTNKQTNKQKMGLDRTQETPMFNKL